jgi:hypothetical protein
MTRPLRIQYPDAWYHVMNRGRRGEAVFVEDQDYRSFIIKLVNLNSGISDCMRGTPLKKQITILLI